MASKRTARVQCSATGKIICLHRQCQLQVHIRADWVLLALSQLEQRTSCRQSHTPFIYLHSKTPEQLQFGLEMQIVNFELEQGGIKVQRKVEL